MLVVTIIGVVVYFLMSINIILMCSNKKKSDQSSKILSPNELIDETKRDEKKKNNKNNKKKTSGEQIKRDDGKSKDFNEKPNNSKEKSKIKTRELKSTQENDTSSEKKKKTKDSKTTKTAEGSSIKGKSVTPSQKDKKIGIDGNLIPAELCGPMDKTIEELDNPAVHDRVTRTAQTDLIFDPKVVKYQGNVDAANAAKNKSEINKMEKELEAACAKHERKVKNPTRKSEDSVKSDDNAAPIPAGSRVRMKPEACLLFETKEQVTDDEELEDKVKKNEEDVEK